MANPSRGWDQVPVFGWWESSPGVPAQGTITLSMGDRIRRQDGRMLWPGGATRQLRIGHPDDQDVQVRANVRQAMRAKAQEALGADFDGAAWDIEWDEKTSSAIFTSFWAADDPDVTPNGYQVQVFESLGGGLNGKTYYIQPLLIHNEQPVPGINLAAIDVPPGAPGAPSPIYAKGIAGGIAALDDDGDVVDAAGTKILPGVGGASSWDELTDKPATFPPATHGHPISEVSGLQTALDGKQPSGSYASASHGHPISEVSGLQTALDGKAGTTHTHAISGVTGLQTALDGKQPSGSYANATHGHAIGDVTGLQAAIDAAAASGPGGGGALPAWEVKLSSFAGANDDAKLSAFMTWAAAQSHRGITVLLDEARDYTFSQTQTLYSGFSIRGTNRPQDQARSSNPLSTRIQLQTSGGWFALGQSQTFGCAFQGLSMNASTNARLVQGHASNVLWTTVFRDLSFQNGQGVLGSSSQKLLLTACAFDGFWNVNNVRDTAFGIGGSDCKMAFTELLLDSPSAFRTATTYLLNLQSLSKSNWRNIYMTADTWSGLTNTGGSRQTFTDCVFEGRNASVENTNGCIVRNSGTLSFRDCWFAYGMVNPAAVTGRTDRGIIHQTGGYMLLDGASYERANGVAESVPLLFASGGKVVVRNVHASGSWTGKPVVQQTSAGIIDADDSVTVVTAA